MSDNLDTGDVAAGFAEPHEYTVWEDIQGYLFGLVLAALLTVASFYVVYTHLIWAPAIPMRWCAGGRADRRAPGFLPASDHGAGQHEQRAGAGVRCSDRRADYWRLAVDHGPSDSA